MSEAERIAQELRNYVSDHENDLLEAGEYAIFADLQLILKDRSIPHETVILAEGDLPSERI